MSWIKKKHRMCILITVSIGIVAFEKKSLDMHSNIPETANSSCKLQACKETAAVTKFDDYTLDKHI